MSKSNPAAYVPQPDFGPYDRLDTRAMQLTNMVVLTIDDPELGGHQVIVKDKRELNDTDRFIEQHWPLAYEPGDSSPLPSEYVASIPRPSSSVTSGEELRRHRGRFNAFF